MSNLILIESWPNSQFVSVNIGTRWIKPDLAFQRYTVGKSKPNYPVPALIQTARFMFGRVWIEDDVNKVLGNFYAIPKMWSKE